MSTTSRSSYTWQVIAELRPTTLRGTIEECEAWAQAVLGMELTSTDAEGVKRVIGVVTRTELKALT